MGEFFGKLSSVAAALASDDLSAAQEELPISLGEPPAGLDAKLSAAWTGLRDLPPIEKAADLPVLRRGFYAWSTAAAALVLELKGAGYDVPFHVLECPMTGTSFPGAPKSARWVQRGEKTLNPYLGLEMQACGKEVEQ